MSESHTVVISQIRALASECGESGWDGEDAKPLDHIAAVSAEEFIRALPEEVPIPEFSPEPDGSVSLDWIQSRKRLFSVSVGATNRLLYAWLDGTNRGHGIAEFDGKKIPPRILEGITALIAQ